MKHLILILFFPFLASANNATLNNKCGKHKAEGFYTEIKSFEHQSAKKKVILLNRGTDSQIIFYIQNKNLTDLDKLLYLGVNFQLTLQFTSLCFYLCEGFIIADSIKSIDPFTPPQLFKGRTDFITGSEIKCKPNSFEETEDPKSSK